MFGLIWQQLFMKLVEAVPEQVQCPAGDCRNSHAVGLERNKLARFRTTKNCAEVKKCRSFLRETHESEWVEGGGWGEVVCALISKKVPKRNKK